MGNRTELPKQPYSFRLGKSPDELEAHEILKSWLLAGWGMSDIVTKALLALGDFDQHEKPQEIDLSEIKSLIIQLQHTLENGVKIDPAAKPKPEEFDTVQLDPGLLANMKKMVRPGRKT